MRERELYRLTLFREIQRCISKDSLSSKGRVGRGQFDVLSLNARGIAAMNEATEGKKNILF